MDTLGKGRVNGVKINWVNYVDLQVYWSDIGGQEEVKERMKEAIEWPLKHPEVLGPDSRLSGACTTKR